MTFDANDAAARRRRDPRARSSTWEEFGEAASVARDRRARGPGSGPTSSIAIARGGLLLAGAIAYALGTKACGSINVEFYSGIDERLPEPVLHPPMLDAPALAGKRVLLVDDVSDSGRTLAMVVAIILRRAGADVRTRDAVHEAAHGARARLRLPAHRRLDHLPLVGAAARSPPREARRMSVHLVGGGWAARTTAACVYAPFLAEAAERAAAVGSGVHAADRGRRRARRRRRGARRAADRRGVAPPVPVRTRRHGVRATATAATGALADVHGIVVGGGLDPRLPRRASSRSSARSAARSPPGVPYLGFSAGPSIAAERALSAAGASAACRWRPRTAAEDLDEVTVENGIGLIDIASTCTPPSGAPSPGSSPRPRPVSSAGGIAHRREHRASSSARARLRVAGAGSVWQVSADRGSGRASRRSAADARRRLTALAAAGLIDAGLGRGARPGAPRASPRSATSSRPRPPPGRGYLPGGRTRAARVRARRSPTCACSSSGRTRTRRRGIRSASRSPSTRHVRPLPRSLANIYRELRDDLGIAAARHGDLSAVEPRRRPAAQPGAHRAARRSRLAPRHGLGGGHRPRDPHPRRARHARSSRSSGAGTPRRSPRCSATRRVIESAHPSPLSASPRILRLPAVQPGERAARRAGRRARRLGLRLTGAASGRRGRARHRSRGYAWPHARRGIPAAPRAAAAPAEARPSPRRRSTYAIRDAVPPTCRTFARSTTTTSPTPP